jgi:hypothetical protein
MYSSVDTLRHDPEVALFLALECRLGRRAVGRRLTNSGTLDGATANVQNA